MACKCGDVSLGNTGLPGCRPIANVASKFFISKHSRMMEVETE